MRWTRFERTGFPRLREQHPPVLRRRRENCQSQGSLAKIRHSALIAASVAQSRYCSHGASFAGPNPAARCAWGDERRRSCSRTPRRTGRCAPPRLPRPRSSTCCPARCRPPRIWRRRSASWRGWTGRRAGASEGCSTGCLDEADVVERTFATDTLKQLLGLVLQTQRSAQARLASHERVERCSLPNALDGPLGQQSDVRRPTAADWPALAGQR